MQATTSREDGCTLLPASIEHLIRLSRDVEARIQQVIPLIHLVPHAHLQESNAEAFFDFLERTLHNQGHNHIARDCAPSHCETCHGAMAFSEVSARDPIFYRHHIHLEVVVQRWRDRHLPRYSRADMEVGDGVQVEAIESVVQHGEHTLTNNLVTYFEEANVGIRDHINIRYNRVNHVPFQWRLRLTNPEMSQQRVMVRIFLAVNSDPTNKRSFEPKEAILMDRFVHELTGEEREEVVRESRANTVSMDGKGLTVQRLHHSITAGEDIGTWCGLPINLYVPR